MKKILTTASLASLAFLACLFSASPASAQNGASSPALIIDNAAQAGRPAGKKQFRYLDMAQTRHASTIRSAVMVYEHGSGEPRCKVRDGDNVSACLRAPST